MEKTEDQVMEEQIKEVLEKLAVFIQKDGGDIHYYSWEPITGTVYVTLTGACQGCAFVDTTITYGVEAIMIEEVQGVNHVVVVDEYGRPVSM